MQDTAIQTNDQIKQPNVKLTAIKEHDSHKVLKLFTHAWKPGLYQNELSGAPEQDGAPVTEREVKRAHFLLSSVADRRITYEEFCRYLTSAFIPVRNPLKDELENLPLLYGGEGSIKRLADCLTVKNFPDEKKVRLLTCWLVGMVAMSLGMEISPLMLILTGGINIGKSYFLRHLLPDELSTYYAESRLQRGKDDELILTTKMLVVVDDADVLSKHEAANIRNYLSAPSFTLRVPFGKTNETFARIAALGATTNETNLIQDAVHNRRLIVFDVTAIDHAPYNAIDKRELLAEAVELAQAGYKYQLTKDDIISLQAATAQFEVSDPAVELLAGCVSKENAGEFLTASEIVGRLNANGALRITSMAVGKAMRALGYERRAKKLNGKTIYGYDLNWRGLAEDISGSVFQRVERLKDG